MKDWEEELELLARLPIPKPSLRPTGGFERSALTRILRCGDAEISRMHVHITEKGQQRLKGPRTPCCGRTMEVHRGGGVVNAAVVWNPYNRVVECLACGEIYIPGSAAQTMLATDTGPYRLWLDAGGGSLDGREEEEA